MNNDAANEARRIAAITVAGMFDTTPEAVRMIDLMQNSTERPDGELAVEVAKVQHPDTVVAYFQQITKSELFKITNARMMRR